MPSSRRMPVPPSQAFQARAKEVYWQVRHYTDNGYSVRTAAAQLNDLKVPMPDGQAWRATTVRQVLTWGIPDMTRSRITDHLGMNRVLITERCEGIHPVNGRPFVVTYYDDVDA